MSQIISTGTSSQTPLTADDLTVNVNLEDVEHSSAALGDVFDTLIDFFCLPSAVNDPMARRFFKEDGNAEQGFIKFMKLIYETKHVLVIVRGNDGYINGFILKKSEDEEYTAYITEARVLRPDPSKKKKGPAQAQETRHQKLKRRLTELGFAKHSPLPFGDGYSNLERVAGITLS